MRLSRLTLLLLLAAAACSKAPRPQAHVTIQEFMEGQVNPAGDFVFKSVQTISDGRGVTLKAPRTKAEWQAVRDQLMVLHDAPDTLTAEGLKAAPAGFKSEHPGIESDPVWIQQAVDSNRPDFNRRAYRLRDAADRSIQAVEAQNPRALQLALDGVDKACESCHLHYFYPNDKRAQQAAREDGIVD